MSDIVINKQNLREVLPSCAVNEIETLGRNSINDNISCVENFLLAFNL